MAESTIDEEMKSWVSRPDVCRCCLSVTGSWDLTVEYVTEDGVKEVFSEMLHECFGISLSHLTDWQMAHLVCEQCAGRLRDACSFKKKVLQVEELITEHCNELVLKIADMKEEEDLFSCISGCHSQDTLGEENDIKTEHPPAVEVKSNINCSNVKKLSKRRKRNPSNDSESDVPIAMLSIKNNIIKNIVNDAKNDTDIQPTKQISERKRVKLTCGVVIQDTTACPFRHHKSWFQCFFCTKEFMDISSLRKHNLENHTDIQTELKLMKRFPRSLQIDISNLECKICNVSLLNVDSMKDHFLSMHKKIVYKEFIADYKIDISPYTCHICNREFHVFRTLTTHLNEHYANCICDVCGRSFINSKRLKVHKRTHENGTFPCSECDKVFKSKMSITNHTESAHSKRVLKCQLCFKPMKHYNDRVKHMSEVHNITYKFKCHICPREFFIKHYLATHVRQTHGNKNKKCGACGMAFITNHGLKKHMLRHASRNGVRA